MPSSPRKPPAITAIVPVYDESSETLAALHESLASQSFSDFEVIIVDDASPSPDYSAIEDSRFTVIYKPHNAGPAAARNTGAQKAGSNVLFFTDADCRLAPDTLSYVNEYMRDHNVCMGNTVTEAHSYLGKAIAYLGFPGGGLLGFHNVWPVDDDGYTESVSSCNLAIRADVFRDIGGFDETFPVAAGEDTMFARSLLDAGYSIKYAPEQLVFHEECPTLADFTKWQITRGRGAYHVQRRIGSIQRYVWRRMRVFGKTLSAAEPRFAPAVAALFLLSLACQWRGHRSEALKHRRERIE